jgi:ornithine cyclodeaminase
MQIVDAAATRAVLPFERLIPALRTMFARGCEVPPRHVHELAAGDGAGLTSLIMPARLPGVAYAVKIINIAAGNAARGLPALQASVLLHDAASDVPLALIDGDEITSRRTAAASALAAGWLAREDARHLLIVGAGRVARLPPAAHHVVRPIARVSVWARSHEAAAAHADELRGDGFDAQPADDLADAAAAADIVSCATLAREPVVHGSWLRAGTHLDLIGSFTPAMREADDEALRGARIYVDTDEALAKSGELLGPIARGVLAAGEVQGTLPPLCCGEVRGRQTVAELTVFKSVGNVLEDLAAAMLVAGIGDGRISMPAGTRAG